MASRTPAGRGAEATGDAPARGRLLLALVLVGGTLASAAAPAAAQTEGAESRTGVSEDGVVRLDARAGIAPPLSDMRRYVDEGPVLGAGLAYRLGERASVRADWTAALMRPADRTNLRRRGADVPARGSETDLHLVTGGLQYELSEPGEARIEVRAHAGLGVTFLSTEETSLAEGGEFTQFTVDGGLELAVPLSDGVRFIGRGDLYLLPVRSGAPDHLLKEVVLPFTGGLAVSL